MKLFNKVAIIGTGLIGGSIALKIKHKRLAGEVVGVSRHKSSLLLAKKKGAIDKGSISLDIIKGADLLIFAAPVNVIMKLAPKASKIVSLDCIVTDVGSTKEEIVSELERLFPNFVGAHPLAGSEKRSIQYSSSEIFCNSLCILTPTIATNKKALETVRRFWQQLGSRVELLTPKEHDRALSFVSHLPHAAAFSLIGTVPKEYLKFSASGLKDTTRIAASDSEIWPDIFLSNRRNMLNVLRLLQNSLSEISLAIREKDKGKLVSILKRAKAKRESLA